MSTGIYLLPPYNPVDVDDVLMAFPAAVEFLMPDPEEILPRNQLPPKWSEFFVDWFRYGIKDIEFHCEEGIDGEKAFRHLQCIIGSYQPKHQHKEQAVVFLASIWFTDNSKWERL